MKKHRKCDTAKYRKQRQKHIQEKRRIQEEKRQQSRTDAKIAQDQELAKRLLGGSFGGT